MNEQGVRENTDMPVEQLRNRLQDKLAHLNSRLATIPDRLRPNLIGEITATVRRIGALNEKASKGTGE